MTRRHGRDFAAHVLMAPVLMVYGGLGPSDNARLWEVMREFSDTVKKSRTEKTSRET